MCLRSNRVVLTSALPLRTNQFVTDDAPQRATGKKLFQMLSLVREGDGPALGSGCGIIKLIRSRGWPVAADLSDNGFPRPNADAASSASRGRKNPLRFRNCFY